VIREERRDVVNRKEKRAEGFPFRSSFSYILPLGKERRGEIED
jgi:hypothetical protein